MGALRNTKPSGHVWGSPRSTRTTSFTRELLLYPCPSLPAFQLPQNSLPTERVLHSSKEGFGDQGAPSPKGPRHSLRSLRGKAKSSNALCSTSIGISCFPCKCGYSLHNPELKSRKGNGWMRGCVWMDPPGPSLQLFA